MATPSRSTRWLVERLRAGSDAELTLSGWSMAPGLRDGDHLKVAPVIGATMRPGEIVVAPRGARLVTHRLVAVRDGMAITRGDACRGEDPPLELGAVVGRVVEVRRGRRRLAPPSRRRGLGLRGVLRWIKGAW